jgi:predicted TIM-barrel fold metal-dependent hydrolase
MSDAALAIPTKLLPYAGKIMDVDTHEQSPINTWNDLYGSVVDPLIEALKVMKLPAILDVREKDDTDINAQTVWKTKLFNAPGAFDFERRIEVMDLTGVKQQIVFPGNLGLFAVWAYAVAGIPEMFSALPGSASERRSYARKLIASHNEWAISVTRSSNRYVVVGALIGETPEELLAEAKRLLKHGIRGIWMPSSVPPAGVSPAHSLLDPLWDALSSADVPVLAHIGADRDFLRTEVWKDASAFEGFRVGAEVPLDPWTLATMNRATENFLATLVMGGVFERHPKLRYGAMETGGNWIGPLAQHLDIWIRQTGLFVGPNAKRPELKMKPSEYIRRNVRVAPFGFEDVGDYIARYDMPELYCYGSDFPHLEGGVDPMGKAVESFERHGISEDIMKMYFVDNAKLLMPH